MRQRLLEMERKNLIGKLITLIQLLVSVICIVTVAGSGMLPKKYLIFLIGALAVLFGATHILQYPKNKVLRYTGYDHQSPDDHHTGSDQYGNDEDR